MNEVGNVWVIKRIEENGIRKLRYKNILVKFNGDGVVTYGRRPWNESTRKFDLERLVFNEQQWDRSKSALKDKFLKYGSAAVVDSEII